MAGCLFHRGVPSGGPAGTREAGCRAGPELVAAGCLFQAILPAFASGWDPRSEPSNVKEQIMFTASGTSCQNGFICPERGITLPSAKYDHLYMRTLPGRTKRYILVSARVGRGPLSGPGSVCVAPSTGSHMSGSKVAVRRGDGPSLPPATATQGTLEAGSQCPHPRHRTIWLLRDTSRPGDPVPHHEAHSMQC